MSKKKFIVGVREVHISYMAVEAECADSAIEAVSEGAGFEQSTEYSFTLDSSLWSVEEHEDETLSQ